MEPQGLRLYRTARDVAHGAERNHTYAGFSEWPNALRPSWRRASTLRALFVLHHHHHHRHHHRIINSIIIVSTPNIAMTNNDIISVVARQNNLIKEIGIRERGERERGIEREEERREAQGEEGRGGSGEWVK